MRPLRHCEGLPVQSTEASQATHEPLGLQTRPLPQAVPAPSIGPSAHTGAPVPHEMTPAKQLLRGLVEQEDCAAQATHAPAPLQTWPPPQTTPAAWPAQTLGAEQRPFSQCPPSQVTPAQLTSTQPPSTHAEPDAQVAEVQVRGTQAPSMQVKRSSQLIPAQFIVTHRALAQTWPVPHVVLPHEVVMQTPLTQLAPETQPGAQMEPPASVPRPPSKP